MLNVVVQVYVSASLDNTDITFLCNIKTQNLTAMDARVKHLNHIIKRLGFVAL